MEVKDKKLIVNITTEDLTLLEEAAKQENRTRNNFIINAAKSKAFTILNKEVNT